MEGVEFSVHYKGAERHFLATAKKYGYIIRIEVQIEDIVVAFEPDEEGQLRAVVDPLNVSNMDAGLIRAIAEELQEGMK